jgi:CO/xanthine dehydrogenase FAD-binding subunit
MVATVIGTADDGTIAEARVAVGACSPVAQRLTQLESDLVGLGPTELPEGVPTLEHLAPLSPIDDVRATATYRLGATMALIRRSLRKWAAS